MSDVHRSVGDSGQSVLRLNMGTPGCGTGWGAAESEIHPGHTQKAMPLYSGTIEWLGGIPRCLHVLSVASLSMVFW